MKTSLVNVSELKRDWLLVDAQDKVLGRLAVEVANILRGKNKVTYCPGHDTGDFVVIINADKVKLTGDKETKKVYQTYSGFRNGLKLTTANVMRKTHPEWMLKLAIERMLPKNNLSRWVFKRLKVYAGDKHPHVAQNLKKIDLL
jgi:large subunit ribosomal protein L13